MAFQISIEILDWSILRKLVFWTCLIKSFRESSWLIRGHQYKIVLWIYLAGVFLLFSDSILSRWNKLWFGCSYNNLWWNWVQLIHEFIGLWAIWMGLGLCYNPTSEFHLLHLKLFACLLIWIALDIDRLPTINRLYILVSRHVLLFYYFLVPDWKLLLWYWQIKVYHIDWVMICWTVVCLLHWR